MQFVNFRESFIILASGPEHVKALDHLHSYLAGTVDLAFIVSFVQEHWQVADSSCECEYYAYSAGVKDMEYVCLLIRDLSALGIDLPDIPTLLIGPSSPSSLGLVPMLPIMCAS
jgi:hypothetical protein